MPVEQGWPSIFFLTTDTAVAVAPFVAATAFLTMVASPMGALAAAFLRGDSRGIVIVVAVIGSNWASQSSEFLDSHQEAQVLHTVQRAATAD